MELLCFTHVFSCICGSAHDYGGVVNGSVAMGANEYYYYRVDSLFGSMCILEPRDLK